MTPTATTMRKVAAVVLVVVVAACRCSDAAVPCNAGQLTVCAGAIAGGAKPTAACCSSLRAQQGCFCQFAKDPRYGRYVNSPNARRAVTSCGIAVPRCH
ncbi:non-specific lipid-transfer protein 2-like [Oryza brachyantha]|uniref:non-specific lipid-transfer protein 2-like n=1 Tax=Oryza brachyantha TaxID=4533 RepID=UPI000776A5F1|nr:non-specific lipid-transfer protein 2-like [Oryza brachyantha]